MVVLQVEALGQLSPSMCRGQGFTAKKELLAPPRTSPQGPKTEGGIRFRMSGCPWPSSDLQLCWLELQQKSRPRPGTGVFSSCGSRSDLENLACACEMLLSASQCLEDIQGLHSGFYGGGTTCPGHQDLDFNRSRVMRTSGKGLTALEWTK